MNKPAIKIEEKLSLSDSDKDFIREYVNNVTNEKERKEKKEEKNVVISFE
jgi:hypothetical protein